MKDILPRCTFAIISHPDAGKTTVTEKILWHGQVIRKAGKVKAKDGSFGFDFEAVYSKIFPFEGFSYGFEKRNVQVDFMDVGDATQVMIAFDPETENPIDMQKNGWQAILNNFKKYAESN